MKLNLRTNPEFGTQINANPPVWFVGMPDIIDKPLGVSYTCDDEKVILLSIWVEG